jgi:hypothetical protein
MSERFIIKQLWVVGGALRREDKLPCRCETRFPTTNLRKNNELSGRVRKKKKPSNFRLTVLPQKPNENNLPTLFSFSVALGLFAFSVVPRLYTLYTPGRPGGHTIGEKNLRKLIRRPNSLNFPGTDATFAKIFSTPL